jgi:hypothetical protein
MSLIISFHAKNTELGIFFNNKAALSANYTLQNSKTKNIKLAVNKTHRIVGIVFDTRKCTSYQIISDFLVKKLKLDEEETEEIMNYIVSLKVQSHSELSETLH